MTDPTSTKPTINTPEVTAAPKKATVKQYRAVISGSYRAGNKDVIDFDNLVVRLPLCDEDVALMHIRGRYAVMAITTAKKADGEKRFVHRVEDLRQVFIDKLEVVEGEQFSYVGKDIKEMEYHELQDLATAKDLRTIQLPKETSGVSLREMRQAAYVAYHEVIEKGDKLDEEEVQRFHDLPELIASAGSRRDKMVRLSNEEVIALEQEKRDVKGTTKDVMTMEKLMGIAKKNGIKYPHGVSFDELYTKVMGSGGAV